MVIDTNGNVGIGTTVPNQKLEVAGTINATAFKLLDSNKIYFGTADDVSQTMDGSFFNITNEVSSIKMFFKGFLGYFFDADTYFADNNLLDINDIGSTSDEIDDIYVGTNQRTYYGDGQEGSIFYNGTALIIS